MKVLITGGAGFIGSNLARALTSRSDVDEVVVLDDLSFGYRSNLDGIDVQFVEGSILDEQVLADASSGVAAIVHLAARSSVPRSIAEPMAAHEVNATGTAMVLEAARRQDGAQVIVASSSSVYGQTDVLPKHESLPARPMSPYAASKLATESYTLAWSHSYGIPTLALRFFNVFGPLQPPLHTYAAVIPAFVFAAMTKRPLPVHGDGTQSRDFTYVDSVVEVIADAIVRRVSHKEPVNLAFGTRITLLQLIAKLEEVLGRTLPIDFLPTRVGDVPASQADASKLGELFPGLEPAPLLEGLQATVDWFKSARPWER
ncbi:MAG: NAD-dependent epimerase/dehydratase family protein [Longimicrobiales bacterium]|jgi:UDP-glucose 4-epimerase|nr:NAD-dependent epimerase/dehydratase family protein [Longimicrobiales bacterium]